MSPIVKPMLAGRCESLPVQFPVLATPKLDGIRCVKINGRALTRSFKPVSNNHIRAMIEAMLPDGVDGELVVKGVPFNEIAGHVGRESGQPDFTFAVFDYVSGDLRKPYDRRMVELSKLPVPSWVDKIIPLLVSSAGELTRYEEACLAEAMRA